MGLLSPENGTRTLPPGVFLFHLADSIGQNLQCIVQMPVHHSHISGRVQIRPRETPYRPDAQIVEAVQHFLRLLRRQGQHRDFCPQIRHPLLQFRLRIYGYRSRALSKVPRIQVKQCNDRESLMYFERSLSKYGIIDKLREAGCEEGDEVWIDDISFEFVN